MSNLKLFRTRGDNVELIIGSSVALEKSLQALMEKNLEVLLGIKFLASEYSTGVKHGGRIDTLGIDENGCPVIIEYKRTVNENVMNQGLYYLDWLLDHKAEFTLLVMEQIDASSASGINWAGTRLLCIAGDFKKYDRHAASQINRNIELIRYTRYGSDFLLLDLINRTETKSLSPSGSDAQLLIEPNKSKKTRKKDRAVTEVLHELTGELSDTYFAFNEFLLNLGDDVSCTSTQLYVAYRRIKNFATMRPMKSQIRVWVNLDPATVELIDGFTRDVTNVGHWGTGDLEISIKSLADLERAKPLLIRSYDET